MKKFIFIILLLGLLCLLLIGCSVKATEDNADNGSKIILAEQELINLKPNDVTSFQVILQPPHKEITITDEKNIVELVAILNRVIMYEQDDSYNEYYGQWVEFELTMADGSLKTVVTYNPFIVVDGIGYKAEYEPCEELNAFANSFIIMQSEQQEQDLDTVDLGCCVKDIKVRQTALLGENSVTHTSNDFIMTLNSDKKVYNTTDKINIWGTLEYIGGNETIEIWHGCPFMLFSITDGNDFNIGGMTEDILASSILERNKVYHFDYQKSGGWSADAPDAKYWENFFGEKDLLLPEGEYTITLNGGFSLSERILESKSGLECKLKIAIEK